MITFLLLSLAVSASVQAPVTDTAFANAAAVRVRASADTTAPVVAQLVLGTELTVLAGGAADWAHVKTADGVEGWISRRFISVFDSSTRWAVAEGVIRERLARTGDGFPAAAELYEFVKRAAGSASDHESQARFALYELRALAATAGAIPFLRAVRETEPYASWLTSHERDLVYSDPAALWMVRQSTFLDTYERYKTAVAADDVLWEAVSTGLPGECETDLGCNLTRMTMVEGEYLKRLPRGRHSAMALRRVADRLKAIREAIVDSAVFDKLSDCTDTEKPAASIREWLALMTSEDRAISRQALDRIAERCK